MIVTLIWSRRWFNAIAGLVVISFAAGCATVPPAFPASESMATAATPAAMAANSAFYGSADTPATPPATALPAQQTPPAGSAVAGVQYVSPLPGSGFNPSGTTIAVRYGTPLEPGDAGSQSFNVTGTASGAHSGKIVLSDDRLTLIFIPAQPFSAGETVEVSVAAWRSPASGSRYPDTGFSFSVAPDPLPPIISTTGTNVTPANSAPAGPAQGTARHYVTVPPDFPTITVTVPASNTAPGVVLASNFGLTPDPSGYYLMMLDNQGEPVYYERVQPKSRAMDFTMQPDGTLSYGDAVSGAWTIMDNTYQVVKTIKPGNGYSVLDQHDLLLLPNGHYLLFANEAHTIDLSNVVDGGNAKASVTGQVIQELDGNDNVVFQWRTLDHFPITDTTESLTGDRIDFSHSNAVALDTDGNLLLSSRHLDEITKIDHATGAIIWRLGGKDNQFTFATAPGVSGPAEFYHQHDVRVLSDGHITVFDNHDGHQPQVSRALEYTLDTDTMTATLVWAYQTDPGVYASAMASVQRLSNGNTLIGWGTVQGPTVTEVTPDGTKAFEIAFNPPNVSYRAFRFEWHGYPDWPPTIAAQAADDALTLTFSWNGATDVASYQVYGGNYLPPAQLVANLPRAGFETSLVVPDAQNAYCYYQVVPVDTQGNLMQSSAVVANPAAGNPACVGRN